jgi:hypothetical protein
MSLTDEELAIVRGNAEVGVLCTLRQCADDVAAIADAIGANDVPLDLIARSLDRAENAAAMLRTMRDEYDMSIRAEAREAIARVE